MPGWRVVLRAAGRAGLSTWLLPTTILPPDLQEVASLQASSCCYASGGYP
jgi:hypothetical protein